MDGMGPIFFRTSENVLKFYWKNLHQQDGVIIDYNQALIGLKTPSMFKWSKMGQLELVTALIVSPEYRTKKLIVAGSQEFTPSEFMDAIAKTKMWTFTGSI